MRSANKLCSITGALTDYHHLRWFDLGGKAKWFPGSFQLRFDFFYPTVTASISAINRGNVEKRERCRSKELIP